MGGSDGNAGAANALVECIGMGMGMGMGKPASPTTPPLKSPPLPAVAEEEADEDDGNAEAEVRGVSDVSLVAAILSTEAQRESTRSPAATSWSRSVVSTTGESAGPAPSDVAREENAAEAVRLVGFPVMRTVGGPR